MNLGGIMAKSNKKRIDKQIDYASGRQEWVKGLIIILVVIGILSIFFLITVHITNNSSDTTISDNKDNTEAVIQYEEILAGSSFSMNEDSYLVLYYDKSDSDLSSEFSSVVSSYNNKDDALALYSVDMDSAFNKDYVKEQSNTSPKSASELSIVGPTLIKFDKGNVSEYIEGKDAILSYLS